MENILNQHFVLVFKTNIKYKKDLPLVESFLKGMNSILKWNVDRSDIDNVLRIECSDNEPTKIINTVNKAGYFCEELPE